MHDFAGDAGRALAFTIALDAINEGFRRAFTKEGDPIRIVDRPGAPA